MIALAFDTETTGKFHWRMPVTHESQPDVVQLCGMLVDENKIHSMFNVFIHADTDIPAEATAIHGVDRELTAKIGISRKTACILLGNYLRKADLLIGHNIDFDVAIMRAAMLREGGDGKLLNKPTFCTMKHATPICKIPHAKPRHPEDYKWPTLQEAYCKLVDPAGFEGAHDAMADVTATYEVFRVLRNQSN